MLEVRKDDEGKMGNENQILNEIEKTKISRKKFSLRKWGMYELPKEIEKLINLTDLDLSENYLESLPEEFIFLKNLKRLNLGRNRFREIPKVILKITGLQELTLNINHIHSVPPGISKLTNLISLDLSNNKITRISPQIGKLTKLENLYLKRNEIKSLPFEAINLVKLSSLDLTDNPAQIPPEILQKDPQQILNYIASQVRRPLNEAKVLIVGQGSVGKTSLVKQLLHDTFDSNEIKTKGISIHQWTVEAKVRRGSQSKNTDNEIQLNLWDFGGQEIMHATHQFFLTKRSLYLLVLDARLEQDENRLEYWLRMIKSFGGDSPVIVVGNKIDHQPLDIDKRGLQAKYPNIKAFVETSCLDGRGIEKLRQVLAREISALSHVTDLISFSWFRIKEKLENLDKDFIPYSEYEALCNKGGVTDVTSQSTLIGFLHDLGSVLNFRDDPRLQETNILNPEWVTNGVCRILNSNELFQKKGVLETRQLSKMLAQAAYPKSRHMFIVDMMRKFELCYPFEGDDGKYLVPDLLPREEPFTGEWADALAFEFHYSVLPGSIISRFIVRMHPFIHQHTVWRTGVVLKSGENPALIKADYEELIEFEKQSIDSFPKKVGPQVVTVDVKQLLDGVEGKSAPQVFISYAHADKRFTNKLVKSLEAAGIRVWKDDKNIQGGAEWHQAIASGITQRKLVLNVLTPNSLESEFVEKELIFAT